MRLTRDLTLIFSPTMDLSLSSFYVHRGNRPDDKGLSLPRLPAEDCNHPDLKQRSQTTASTPKVPRQ